MIENRYEYSELEYISKLWAQKLKDALDDIPEEWMEKAFKS